MNMDEFCRTFCENVECTECPVNIDKIEIRTTNQKLSGEPCFINLIEWVEQNVRKN